MATTFNFRCPVCMKPFHQPKLLEQCMHSFCKQCICTHVKPLLSNNNETGNRLDCPVCKTSFPGPSSSDGLADWLDNLPSDSLLQQHISPKAGDQSSSNCEPCAFRKQDSIAIKICKDCNEQLCEQCADVHLASKGTRSHVLLNTDSSAIKDIELSANCEIHENKTIEYYCKTHDELICSKCAVLNHRVCDILEIEKVSETLALANSTEKLKSDVELLHADIDKSYKIIQEENDRFQNNVQRVLMDVEEKRKQVNSSFDRYKQNIVDEVKQHIKLGENTKTGIKRTSMGIENSLVLLSTAIQRGNHLQVYKRSKALKRQVDCSRKIINETQSGNRSPKITYSFSPSVTAMITFGSDSVGTFQVKKDDDVTPYHGAQSKGLKTTRDCNETKGINTSKLDHLASSNVPRSKESRVLKPEGSLQVNTIETKSKPTSSLKPKTSSTSDTLLSSPTCSGQTEFVEQKNTTQPNNRKYKFKIDPWGVCIEEPRAQTGVRMKSSHTLNVVLPDGSKPFFGGAAYLNDGRVVLTDVKYHRLILLDCDEKFVSELELERRPRKVTATHKNKVAVGLSNSNKILIVKVDGKLVISKCVYTSLLSKCVLSSNHQLFTTSYSKNIEDEWSLTCFNLQNDEEIELEKMKGFDDGTHLAIFNKGNRNFLLHSCRNDDTLKCHTEDGKEVFCYKINGPRGVDIDKFGNIFVASYLRGTILHLTNTGKLVNTLIVRGLYKPYEVRINRTNDKLLVTQYESSEIHILQLAYQ